MHVRSISSEEVTTFCSHRRDPERAAAVQRYMEQMLAAGSMRPEWCFLVENHDGRPIGATGLWSPPALSIPSDIVLLELPWAEDFHAVGELLLRHALEVMHHHGATSVGHVLDTPPVWPQWQTDIERRMEFLARSGFTLERETRRFEWQVRQGQRSLPAPSQRLQFRSLPEVGEEAFIEAVVRVSAGTLDQLIRQQREELGPEQAGRELFALLQQFTFVPEWWGLAYTLEGQLVGLHMPATMPSAATIGYIGVLPEYRGQGYIDDLLVQATRTLAHAQAERIVADTDIANAPMANAFLRAGYVQFATRGELRRRL